VVGRCPCARRGCRACLPARLPPRCAQGGTHCGAGAPKRPPRPSGCRPRAAAAAKLLPHLTLTGSPCWIARRSLATSFWSVPSPCRKRLRQEGTRACARAHTHTHTQRAQRPHGRASDAVLLLQLCATYSVRADVRRCGGRAPDDGSAASSAAARAAAAANPAPRQRRRHRLHAHQLCPSTSSEE
jgi:hypothetical protein